MEFPRTDCYDRNFLEQNMMGPNAMVMLEELLRSVPMRKGMRILDLGCGRGLSSIFLAREWEARVFAVDLWISAADNYRRFREMGLEEQIIPIHADANELPFAEGYFDAVVSVDAYHYVGNRENFFEQKILPFLGKDAIVALAFPGMKQEVQGRVPKRMEPYWEEEALEMWHSMDWWRPKFAGALKDLNIWEMQCFDRAWADWLSTDNPYAAGDRNMLKADGGEFMNLIGVTGVAAGADR